MPDSTRTPTNDLSAYCGLYCGACRWSTTFPRTPSPAAADSCDKNGTCPGCRSTGNICGFCKMKNCAVAKGLNSCAACADYPCDLLRAFQADGKPHHGDVFNNLERLKSVGPAAWLAEQEKRWTCSCGARFSWYDTTCERCGAAVPSYADAKRP